MPTSAKLRYLACAVLLLLIAAFAPATGQTGPAVAFEVASVKPSQPPTPEQLRSNSVLMGAKVNPTTAEFGQMSLRDLILRAWQVRPFQLSGPGWMDTAKFDIVARIPAGSSTRDVPSMLQTLLADRFKLALHQESKEFAVYALITGKDGVKLAARPVPDDPAARKGRAPISLADLAQLLSRFMDHPVIDQTGLEGEYLVPTEAIVREEMQVLLARKASPTPPLESPSTGIFAIMQSFGLKVEARKMSLPLLVVDRVEKQPTEN